ncbi:PBSX family phage terminase large subunit [Streptococcus iniae]|uniref:PBSX family phage terminase large subunit n=1 Tax=Streptococcus iniae TaxID=1346 RepID=UPI000EF6E699|nr:PBSX family phage terminase large subunit [Streptococcus iniae]RLU51569.1 PBSX family phage terminase large subunit [Streptococcus iniae]RLU58561.1 PBSX family phage terminase large subunit [Streptococcus iniae]RLU60553.1 PBSX family phage terminase large subunit [Streptococcus iniae]RLU68713.1 PBSX family phage terminase large subunit [Streptococcus iniae]RLU82703.1 PBSX family phage terminase large subunit [Streptococcus iniae]
MNLTKLYTPKQLKVLKYIWTHDWFICGLHGAKRAGKTVVNNDTFVTELDRVRAIADRLDIDEPMYILAGTSSTSIQNNVLQELYNKYGFIPKYDKHGSFTFRGVKVVQVYTGSISGLKRARGFTSFGAYVNEASLANEDVFKEIISRCSGDGARIVWDSNPDNPNHWLKRDYIDNKDDKIINFSFQLDDNTFLSERYINSIKSATPNGKFYDRDILGKWTIAEGAIYSDYDKSIHEIDILPDMARYFAGVDWGYDHYGSIVIIGEDVKGNQYLVDGISEQYKEIDWWVDRAKEFKAKYGDIVFWADSARPEHVARFKKEKIKARNAKKAVIAGIEDVAKKFKENKLFIKREVIPRFFDEIYQYKWKPNSTKDEPLKEYDDVLDAIRYAIYSDAHSKTIVKTFKGGI